jgi:arsenite methyltransferase
MSELRDVIQQKYGEAARRAATGQEKGGCCGTGCGCADPITSDLYGADETGALPAEAVAASLGCGNPTALIDLREGETVLDLGSGGGIDVLLSARRVGPRGKVYGLDMTDEMLALARENQRKAGATNVEFLRGEIEHIPLPDNSVDVIISNCVINLSADKGRVLREAFRVGDVPADVRRSVELWVGCVAGALQESEYRTLLERAGFSDIEVDVWRTYDVADAREFLTGAGLDVDAIAPQVEGKFASAVVRAHKR